MGTENPLLERHKQHETTEVRELVRLASRLVYALIYDMYPALIARRYLAVDARPSLDVTFRRIAAALRILGALKFVEVGGLFMAPLPFFYTFARAAQSSE